jgi:IS6 family transposase
MYPFEWRHYPGDIIMWCVRWYLRYPIAVAQMGEMARERGLAISPSCVWRWVQTYGPELDKRCRRPLKPTNRSGRVEQTYIKVKGQERFLYRAVDSSGQTIDFLLTAKRDTAAAKRFFQRGMASPGNSLPRGINVDRNRAYPVAVDELKRDGTIRRRCKLRQCKYLNNVVEQDHRNVKCRTWLAKGYGWVRKARRTLRGIEAMGMIGKGRVRRAGKGDVVAPVKFISKLFGIAA